MRREVVLTMPARLRSAALNTYCLEWDEDDAEEEEAYFITQLAWKQMSTPFSSSSVKLSAVRLLVKGDDELTA